MSPPISFRHYAFPLTRTSLVAMPFVRKQRLAHRHEYFIGNIRIIHRSGKRERARERADNGQNVCSS